MSGCPWGRQHRRADAHAGDHRPSHGAVGRGDPDLHRLRRRRRVGDRRAPPRRARRVASTTPSLNDFVVKAAALALRELPRFNASYVDGRVELLLARQRRGRGCGGRRAAGPRRRSTPTGRTSPRSPPRRGGSWTERAAVRSGLEELRGGTFTVSNLGMLGVQLVHRDRRPATDGDSCRRLGPTRAGRRTTRGTSSSAT